MGKRRGHEHDGDPECPLPGAPSPEQHGQIGTGGRDMMQQLSAEARNLNWLVSNFVERVPGVQEATVVSSDGLLIALSDGLDRSSGDRLAAVSAGLLSIAKGGSTPIGGGRVHEVIVEMDQAMLFVMRVSDTSVLAVDDGTAVRRRPRRLRDGRPRREVRERADARARLRAADRAAAIGDPVTCTGATMTRTRRGR